MSLLERSPPYEAPYWGLKPDAYHMLISMLSYRRPHGTRAEKRFVKHFLMPLNPNVDGFGNLIVSIGDNPNVLWSSHTDTVHSEGGRQQIYQTEDGLLCVTDDQQDSNCLGADCTTGVWLMVQMIQAKKPGLYVFHRAEEVGCQGSSWIAENTPELLEGIDYAIAFDRYGTKHVITHQMGRRCCSDDFAFALARQLGPNYHPDDGGSYTDTNEYTSLIPECTNIAVGYYDQHSKREVQNLSHLADMLPALLALDTTKLPVERDPSDTEDIWGGDHYSFPSWSLTELVRDNPDEVAYFLSSLGINSTELAEEIYNQSGRFPV